MSPQMMTMLMQAEPTMREKLFLAMMREHHQSALDIGPMVLQKATHQELKDQAQNMITSQKQEQDMFGGWLQGLYSIAAQEVNVTPCRVAYGRANVSVRSISAGMSTGPR